MQLKEWAFLGDYNFFTDRLKNLATTQLVPEKWSYAGKEDFGILKNYLHFTFDKLWQEFEEADENAKPLILFMSSSHACFNTGLFDKNWQPVYFVCKKNPVEDKQPWRFDGFLNSYTISAAGLPVASVQSLRRASYFQNPGELIFNVELEIVPQWNHILDGEDNFQRIPKSLRDNGKDFCRNLIDGAIRSVKKRIQANYKTAVPQIYKGRIQLLIPLYLTNPDIADLALVVSLSEDRSVYLGHTCLTREMAYNNARVIARPDSYWLQP